MKRLLLLFLLCFGLALPVVAADGTSFNPPTISVKSVGASIPVGTVITWPSNSWPSDRDNWLECNGQSISSAVYPELVGVLGKTAVPDYRGHFLRGLQSGHSVGESVANSIKSHNHTQPTHTHSFSGQLVSTALSGTAGGQSFSSAASLGVSGWAAGQSITSGGAGGQSFSYQGSTTGSGGYVTFRHDSGTTSGGNGAGGVVPSYSATPPTSSGLPWEPTITENHGIVYSKYSDGSGDERHTVTNSYVPFSGGETQTLAGTTSGGSIWGSTGGGSISGTASGTVSGTTNASGVSGALRNGSVSGSIDAGGGNPTDYTGETERAPDHVYVQCLIRANP